MSDLRKYTYGKEEKLKSRKLISEIFESGKSFYSYPLRIFYKEVEDIDSNIQLGVSVSKRNFKLAVDRNRIKRLMREAYRLEKYSYKTEGKKLVAMFVYTQRKEISIDEMRKSFSKALNRLSKEMSNI